MLGKPGKAEQAVLAEVYQKAADAVQRIMAGRLSEAQALYNKKHEGL